MALPSGRPVGYASRGPRPAHRAWHYDGPMDVVYLDNNATTRVCEEAVAAMATVLSEDYGNPSSVHRFGQRARRLIDEARGRTAALIGCTEHELIFTGGGTEAISTAVRGLLAARGPRRRIVTTTVEHSATRELCAALAREGAAEVVEVGVDRQGRLDLDAFDRATDKPDEVALVTLLWANNETGVIFPVEEVASRCRAARVPLHVDGTQMVGKVRVNVAEVGGGGISAMSFAGHKFHGPKGVGGLYLRKGVRVRPWLVGGPQERGRRGGTENVAGIVGMGVAAEVAGARLGEMARVAALRDELESRLLERVPETSVNGDRASRLPNTTNLSFARLEAEAILILLSERGISASAGAACASGSLEPSHVLRAMGIEPKVAHGAIRFSLSRYTTPADIDAASEAVAAVTARLRETLPLGI